jgi:hypothetical protein
LQQPRASFEETFMASGQQKQDSRQSIDNPKGDDRQQGSGKADPQSGTGIGASQGQDRGKRPDGKKNGERSSGTADIERANPIPGSGTDSLVNDPTGAFKERP